MRAASKNRTAYILAGGRSARMGEDKGLMLLSGKKMIEYGIEQVAPCVDELIIVANNPAYQQFGYKVIEDIKKDLGPIGGIYTALRNTSTQFNVVVSCDMPFITTDALNYVIGEASESDITIPTIGGRMQPLFGVYTKDCLKRIEMNIAAKKLKMMRLVTGFDCKLVPMEKRGQDTTFLFRNINTPEEFELASKELALWK